MRNLRFNLLSLLVLMAAIGAAACSTSFYASQSIASSPDNVMRENIASQISATQTRNSQTNIQTNIQGSTQTSIQTSTQTSTQSSRNSSETHSSSFTTINLRAANLNQPHRLIIRSSGSTLAGQITLDGKAIQTLQSNPTEIDLAPYLSAGQHEIEIVGHSTPATANLTIEFVAPGTRTMQQTSGGNQLQLILLID